jgi:septal ring factor EnvC (AmiA/AmiB activator)
LTKKPRKLQRHDQDQRLADLKTEIKALERRNRALAIEDQVRERDERIKELRRELSEAEELISDMREQVERANGVIESWIEAFGMTQDDKGVWQWDEWMDRWTGMHKAYDAVVQKWNRFVRSR